MSDIFCNQGASADCPMAFRQPDDTFAQVACQANDVSPV